MIGYDLAGVEVNAGPRARARIAEVQALTSEIVRADFAESFPEAPARVGFDALLSDMAPKLTGIRDADQARSVALAEAALHLALGLVVESGVFVAKLFQGRGSDALLLEVKRAFRSVRMLKPEATREGSREVFVIARGRKLPGAKKD